MQNYSILSDATNRSEVTSTLMTNSTNELDQSTSINLIIKKLGHELEEIRMRSLDNLISKLDSEILSEYSLCQHKQLFVKLFEFFNYPEFAQKEKVLDLLLRFSKNKSAIKNIYDINGLMFLNSLKNDLKESNLKDKIDEIVENLVENTSHSESNINGLLKKKQLFEKKTLLIVIYL
jgi:hypothetical protein